MTNYITKGIGGFYYVKTETGIVECRARGIFRKRGITPVAGDQVVLSADHTTIDEILPRKNVFIRPPVANLDVLFIVASTTQPVPSTLMPLQRAQAARCRGESCLLVAREKREWMCRSAMKFMDRLRDVRMRKPILLWKAGRKARAVHSRDRTCQLR